MQSGLPADLLIEIHETIPPDVREEIERFVRECPKTAAWLLGTRTKTVELKLFIQGGQIVGRSSVSHGVSYGHTDSEVSA